MKISITYYFLITIIILGTGCKKRYSSEHRDLSIFERIAHERTDDAIMEEFIDSLLLRMTLTEKIGQMTQITIQTVSIVGHYHIIGSGLEFVSIE